MGVSETSIPVRGVNEIGFCTDPAEFRKKVEQEEQKLLQQAEYLRLAGEKEKEVKSLKNHSGRRVNY